MDQTETIIKRFSFPKFENGTSGSSAETPGFSPFPYKSTPVSGERIRVVEEEKPKEQMFSEKDILENRQKGYEEGYAKGYSNAKSAEAEMEKNIQASLDEIKLKLAAIGEVVKTRNDAHIKEIIELVLKVARKVAGTALKCEPFEEIENVIKMSLPLLFDEPRITIIVNTSLVENIEKRIIALAKNEGFKNTIEISGSQELSMGSCDIEWNGGGIRGHKDIIWNKIEGLVGSL